MSINFQGLQGRAVRSYEDAVEFWRAIEQCIPDLHDNGKYVISRGNEFWKFYHENKDALRQARLYVFKEGSDWIIEAKPLYDPDARRKEALEKVLQRWRRHLKGCCVGFLEMQIFEKVQSNGVTRYLLYCPQCKSACSSALPYMLVEHFLKHIGLELVMRADNLDG